MCKMPNNFNGLNRQGRQGRQDLLDESVNEIGVFKRFRKQNM